MGKSNPAGEFLSESDEPVISGWQRMALCHEDFNSRRGILIEARSERFIQVGGRHCFDGCLSLIGLFDKNQFAEDVIKVSCNEYRICCLSSGLHEQTPQAVKFGFLR